MDRKAKAILGAAAGVATAAVAVAGVVASRRSAGTVASYRVEAGEGGWVVADGSQPPEHAYGTKREAVAAGRKVAAENAPSHLVIQRADGTVQTRHSYGIDEH